MLTIGSVEVLAVPVPLQQLVSSGHDSTLELHALRAHIIVSSLYEMLQDARPECVPG
jgi:hypothetical protein